MAAVNCVESRYLSLGGIAQWVHIRGRDPKNPVLLWLAGGPGASTIPYSDRYRAWEEHFTLVMWDQRGAGKTFERHGTSLAATMNATRMANDGLELAEYLRERFRGAPIVLLGHSWGSLLGINMIRDRPDLFAAYVGTGQVTYLKRQLEVAYPFLLERAARLGNATATAQLTAIGPPSNDSWAYGAASSWAAALDFQAHSLPATTSPQPSEGSVLEPAPRYIVDGFEFSRRALSAELVSTDIAAAGSVFSIPMFFFQGENDLLTATAEVRRYFDDVVAPRKTFAIIRGAGHFAVVHAGEQFLSRLLADVSPAITDQPS